MGEEQLLRCVREDFYRTEELPTVDGGGNMQYLFDAFSETHQSSSLRSLGMPERSASPSCTEQVALENYLPGGFFASNSLDHVGDVRIDTLEPAVAAIERSNSTKQQQQLEVMRAAAASELIADFYDHNSSLRTASRLSLKLQQMQEFLFEDHPQDIERPGQPNSDAVHLSRNNSVASTSDCKSTSNVNVDVEVEIQPKLWRGCSPSILMLQLQGPPASTASASKLSNFDHRPNNINISFDNQPLNIISSTCNNTQSTSQQQLNHMPSISAPSTPNLFYSQPRVLTKTAHRSYSNAERDSSFQPQFMCSKGAGDHNSINTSMTMSWATHLPDHQQQTRRQGGTESCHHPWSRGAPTSSECEVNAVDQSFTANSHATLPGSSWPHSRRQIKPARVDNSSGNNSWSSCTSPSPSSNDHNEEALGPINIASILDMKPSHLKNFPGYVVSELERTRKRAKATVSTRDHVAAAAAGGGNTASEDGFILSAGNNLGDQHHHQKRKCSLKEKILHIARQPDLHTPKEYQIQELDDTIECLNALRRSLNDPLCSSPQQQLQRAMGTLTDAADTKNRNESAATADASVSLRSSKLAGVDGVSSPLQLEKLGLDTEGVDYMSVDSTSVPYLKLRMMEEHEVIVKLTTRDRPGLFNDIMMVLKNLQLDIQHYNIRTNQGERQDIFAVKPNCSIDTQSTIRLIGNALNSVICPPHDWPK